jgi:hypothetical protein
LFNRLSVGDRVRIILTIAGEEHLNNKTGKIIELGIPPETSSGDVLTPQNPRLVKGYWVVKLDDTGGEVNLREEALEIIV